VNTEAAQGRVHRGGDIFATDREWECAEGEEGVQKWEQLIGSKSVELMGEGAKKRWRRKDRRNGVGSCE
jgi:hypothetical protein